MIGRRAGGPAAGGGGVAVVVARARPALSPTVPIAEEPAPDLYRLVRDLADRLDVPAPSAIALTPDCDSWLEDRTHRPTAAPRRRRRPRSPARRDSARSRGPARAPGASPHGRGGHPLRAGASGARPGSGPGHRLAVPVVDAGRRAARGARARRRGYRPRRAPGHSRRPPFRARAGRRRGGRGAGPASRRSGTRAGCRARLRRLGRPAAAARLPATTPRQMERAVAAAASERAQAVDYGLRIVAQEQVGLAYAGWDRLLTRVALPAWRMGRWPSRLDAGRGLRAHRALPPRPAGRGLRLPARRAARLRPAGGARR